jgi:hypothetical protein
MTGKNRADSKPSLPNLHIVGVEQPGMQKKRKRGMPCRGPLSLLNLTQRTLLSSHDTNSFD